jgi:phage terminase large subunit
MFGYEFNPAIVGGNAPDVELENGQLRIELPEKAVFLLTQKARFKVLHGGRGSAKSWSMAQALVLKAHNERPMVRSGKQDVAGEDIFVPGSHLILCAREYQNSIADSVHRLIKGAIYRLGLAPWFDIQNNIIRSLVTGAELIFKGLHRNIMEIKSTEGITICWVEEAQSVSAESWETLIPTIRGMDGAEIWVSFNPYLAEDPTSVRFLGTDPKKKVDPRAIVAQMNWTDNEWFPPDMEQDRLALLRTDPEAYEHVYEGSFLQLSEATIFRGRYEVRSFDEPPPGTRFYHGMDFGFADDPSTLLRCWTDEKTNTLYIDREAWGLHVEIDDLPAMMSGGLSIKNGKEYPGIETAKTWPIKADGARPETISYLSRQGYNIQAAEKWPGSVEDGIAHLKGFSKIIIHETNCPNMAREARLYKYKVDKQTGDVLPIVVDAHNHGWDAIRYSLDGYIKDRGGFGIWRKLAR